MYGVLAKTYFRAAGIPTKRPHRDTHRSWYGEELGTNPVPRRWEDWK